MPDVQKSESERREELFRRRRRTRSIAIGVALAALVVIFYAITVVKIGPAAFVREL